LKKKYYEDGEEDNNKGTRKNEVKNKKKRGLIPESERLRIYSLFQGPAVANKQNFQSIRQLYTRHHYIWKQWVYSLPCEVTVVLRILQVAEGSKHVIGRLILR
jgi:hypothetical protein